MSGDYTLTLSLTKLVAKDFKQGILKIIRADSLAKFKKKKSKPTPDPHDSEKKDVTNDKENLPEIEKESPPEINKTSKAESEDNVSEVTTNQNKAKLDKLFWIRIGLAVVAGVTATFIFEPIEGEERRWASIGFMIIIFIASVIFAKGMGLQLAKSDRKKLVTTGIGSYVFIYLFMWILSYTLVHLPSTGGIPSPIP